MNGSELNPQSEPSPEGSAAHPIPPGERFSGETIDLLLVDDDARHIQSTQDILRSAFNCRIEVATTAKQAVQKISHGIEFHAILLDNILPDMSGLDLLAMLRSSSHSVPVILVTVSGGEATVVEAMRRGANDYIVKSGDYLRVIPEVVAHVVESERLRRRAKQLEAEHIHFARMAAIGEVAAGIAHEIRNPMTIMVGMASLIRENHGALSAEEIERCAQSIMDNCSHLNKVLEEILQDVQHSQERESIDLRELIIETLSFMRFDLEWRNHIEVRSNFVETGLLMGSRNQLKQVLINLFRNASQAVRMAGKQKGHLYISLHEDGNTGDVVVSIADDGAGIAPEILPHIFESGFSTKKRDAVVQGTGLGLSICRRIVQEHQGSLWAENNEYGGATFFIAMPSLVEEA